MTKWISVNDSYPSDELVEENSEFLVVIKTNTHCYVDCMRYTKTIGWWSLSHITHWMPFPELPENI